MPELPEMENYRILLEERITGKKVTGIAITRPKSLNVPVDQFTNAVNHQKVARITRRAKHLLFHLENGYVLILHLMLGGLLYYGPAEDEPDRTIQVNLGFGMEHLYFMGLRLGYLHIYREEDAEKELSFLGPEPLETEFSAQRFIELLSARRGRLKSRLVDQSFISGIGNCYSDEMCFESGILPLKMIEDLNDTEKVNLYHAMKAVLQNAIKHGGYMERPFFKGDQLTGGYNELCKVYDRENESCMRCGHPIKKEMVSSRKVFYCPGCQQ